MRGFGQAPGGADKLKTAIVSQARLSDAAPGGG